MTKYLPIFMASTLIATACSNDRPEQPKAPPQKVQPMTTFATTPDQIVKAHATPHPPAAKTVGAKIEGRVSETMEAGGYTYAELTNESGETVWTAGPKTALRIGDLVVAEPGTEMHNFRSKTLNREFEKIHFLSSFSGSNYAAPRQTVNSHSQNGFNHTQSAQRPRPPKANPSPNDGATISVSSIAALFKEAPTISGQRVKISGKVVKFSAGIMGRNWLHLQDGSGDAASKNNDLTVTTDDIASVGDLVSIEGTLSTNRDFGAGYAYAAILEQATLTANKPSPTGSLP